MLSMLLLSSAYAAPLPPILSPTVASVDGAAPTPRDEPAQIESSILRAKLYIASGAAIGTFGVGTTILGTALLAEGLNDSGDYRGLGIVTGVFVGGVGLAGIATGVTLVRAGVKQKQEGEQALQGAALSITPTPNGLVVSGRF